MGIFGFDILSLEHLAQMQTWHLVTARYASTVLFIVCALAWKLNNWLEDGVSRNARTHAAILTGIFGAQAIGFLLISNYRRSAPYAGIAFIGCQAVLTAIWAVTMMRRSEFPVFVKTTGDTRILTNLPTVTKQVLRALE